MLKTPMHNRFAEGFLESHSSGWGLDPLSTRITPTPFIDLEIEEFHRRARIARDAAIAAAIVRAWQELRAIARVLNPVTPLFRWYRAWRARERAADELFALDDRTLAELGLRRGDIPFVAAGAVPSRDDPRDDVVRPRVANDRVANDNDNSEHAA
jgi:uncharacterized protein YjiS (DUF1127 family)